jgi:hypothetical protein
MPSGAAQFCELAKEISHIQVLVILLFSNPTHKAPSPK